MWCWSAQSTVSIHLQQTSAGLELDQSLHRPLLPYLGCQHRVHLTIAGTVWLAAAAGGAASAVAPMGMCLVLYSDWLDGAQLQSMYIMCIGSVRFQCRAELTCPACTCYLYLCGTCPCQIHLQHLHTGHHTHVVPHSLHPTG